MRYNRGTPADLSERLIPAKMIVEANSQEQQELVNPDIKITAEIIEQFVQYYLLSDFDKPVKTPEFHREMWRTCSSDNKYLVLAAPRGHAKSSAITLAYVLCACLFRQRDFVVILSDTYGQSIEFLRDLKTVLFENDKIIKDFETKNTIKETEDDIIVQMRDGYKFRIVCRGSEQKVRGLKWNNKRPNLIVGDDLEGDAQVESKERREKFFRWLMRAVLPCGSDDCLYRIVGTVLHFDSALQKLLNDKTWVSRRFAAHKGYDDFSDILWTQKFNEERLRAIRQKYIEQGDPDGYSQEYLNNPIAEGERYFKELTEIPKDNNGRYALPTLKYYVGWDFAVSTKTKADYTAYCVVGVDSEGRKYVIDVERDRMDSKSIVDTMFRIEKRYKPEVHFIERGVIDLSIEPFLNTEMLNKQCWLNIFKMASTKDKPTRAKTMQGMIRAKHILFDMEMPYFHELLEEIRRFPKGGHDDMVDALCIIGLGLQELAPANTEDEALDEEFAETQDFEGRNLVTGY